MNHLAHLFLASGAPLPSAAPAPPGTTALHRAQLVIGNLAGDFVKGPIGDRFPPAIAAGIAQHRRLDAFTASHRHLAPFRRVVYPRMRDEGWLLSYREIDGIELALRNMSRRFSRKPRLETATHHLIDSREELEREFDHFFPDVVSFSKGEDTYAN